MDVPGPFVHHIDPIIGTLFGVHLWWYGASYTLGFLGALLFLLHRRGQVDLSEKAAWDLAILLAVGVLLGGRLVEVVFYEWPFYRDHLGLISAYWLGGMATHGLLFGGLVGVWIFARVYGLSFLRVTDMLAIPAAVIMGLGRLGNFIDGQIVGSVTSLPWAVKFPDAEGFRHPVVLYDALKNLLIVPILFGLEKRQPPRGMCTGLFLFLYAFLRIFVDLFREYPTSLLGLATGQVLNIVLSLVGIGFIVVPLVKNRGRAKTSAPSLLHDIHTPVARLRWRPLVFAVILLFALVIPSDWTQDVPARYGKRHAGLEHTILYPRITP